MSLIDDSSFLVWQIFVVLRGAGEPTGIRSLCVYGGTPKGPQISSLKSGVVCSSSAFFILFILTSHGIFLMKRSLLSEWLS